MNRRPRSWSVAAIRVATLLLPRGPLRRRYRDELTAELWGMTTSRQLQHALSVLASAPPLRRALFEAGELHFPHSPLWCRLHLHHRWHLERTADNTAYRRCQVCGTDDDETARPGSRAGEGFGLTGVHPN